MNVEKLMNRAVKTCSPSDTLDTVAKIMWEGDCGIVPIVTNDGHIVGVKSGKPVRSSPQPRPCPRNGIWRARCRA